VESWTTKGIDEAARAALLERLPASEVWSLLLALMECRAGQRSTSDLTHQYARDGFTQAAFVDQRAFVALDAQLFAAADRFAAIELSPLAPLGVCSVMGRASQNKIVSALRGTEVVADPTNVLALECARRLREAPEATVRLATSHRCVRAQPFPKKPGFAPHFRIFCLASAGRERQNHAFLVESLVEQITVLLAALDRLAAHGFRVPPRRLTLLATADRSAVADRVAAAIAGVPVKRVPLEHAYYDGIRFMINVGDDGEGGIPLCDGGAFDWVARLAANRRLVFVASGMGSQLVAAAFRTGS
jgi:hypothetical protein